MPPAKRSRAALARNSKPTDGTSTAARAVLMEKASNATEKTAQRNKLKRPASEDVSEIQDSSETTRPGRGRPRATKAPKIAETEDELSVLQMETAAPPRAKRGRKPKATTEAEVPETQQPETVIDEIPETQPADGADISKEQEQPVKMLPRMDVQPISSPRRQQSRLVSSPVRKSGFAPEWDQTEANLRRRVGDLSRKCESLEAKYRDLREIGVQEAERNFDRLQKQSEERASTDKQLIATLQAKLAAETALAKEAERSRKQFEDSQSKVEELQRKLEDMQHSLAEAKTEIKTLSAKLTAARSSETTHAKVPGSAMKNTHANNRLLANAAEAAAQLAQKKENLYGDLTGLLVCGVRREKDDEVFDCVQTGRNGTLHFKLAASPEGASDNFDDAQFMYMPQLDSARDAGLIELLPDYLTEDITFPRLHAAKFYSRVVKALSERPE
ncbi:chromosome segregation protein Csm1/Pcs1-domain-containing protein [Xylariaceae sp. FL0594]|nr:chromosome segregation protein Csm1/Pcs1-domain-containing protein [Xylariaceae sp. FL0594]